MDTHECPINRLLHRPAGIELRSPHNVLAVIHIDVVADKHKPVDGVSDFITRVDVADLL